MKIITARPHRLLKIVIDRIGKAAQEGKRCMFLVPSQYTLQAEIEIMAQLDLEGSFLIDVLSPGRLQSRVFERAGMPDRTVFDERGKRMILSEIVDQQKENLTVYRSAAHKGADGLAAKMSSLIADFKRSGKTAQEIADAAQAVQDTPVGRKLKDAARIYAAYEQRTSSLLCDAEDVMGIFLEKLAYSGVLNEQHVFVYGFDMITPQFARELTQIARHAAALTLAVETDENSASDGRLFAPVNFSLERLREEAARQGTVLQWERMQAQLDAPWDIRLMEERLFALGAKPCEDRPENIELYAVSSMRQEIHSAAARIRAAMHGGEEAAAMAVVYPKDSGYAALIPGVFAQYGLTPYVAEKRPALSHPLCRFMLSALSVVSGGWRTADIVECIQSGFLKLEDHEKDELCAYLEGMDVRSEAIRRPLRYIKGGDEQALLALNSSRERVCAPLERLSAAMRSANSADDAVAAIVALLEDVSAFDTLGDMRDELMEAGLTPQAEDCAQVWNQVMETLDQLHALLGERPVSAKLVMRLLVSGLSALELSALPPADGAIVCGEIGNVRTGRVDTLFALGMNDTAGAAAEGLFTAAEQEEAARATGAYMGMSAAQRAALAQLDELKALACAGGRLIVSYALSDETGRALREGAAVQAMRRVFEKLEVRGGLAAQEREAMLCAPDAALEAMSVRLSDAADGRELLDAPYTSAYAALQESKEGREKLLSVTRRLGRMPERRLNASRARVLYGRPVMSVSRLEMQAQCPYRHFVTYGLSPQPNLTPGVDRAELGTLYHEAAERFTKAVAALENFPQIDEKTCDRIMDESVKPLIEIWKQSPLGESKRGEAFARRIARTARRAGRSIVGQFAGSEFVPARYEMVFGRHGAAPIMLELADGTFAYLQGRIDRIDILDGETKCIRVIDYKSGNKKFDPTMAYFGIQLQLLIYLVAAMEQIPGMQPGGFFYCRIADPTVRSESRIREEVERQIAKKLSLAGISLSDVQVLRAQGREHAAMITREGKASGTYRGSMIDAEGMQAMAHFARRKAAELAQEAYAGMIDDLPAEHGAYNACSTCDYAAVCGFDPTLKRRRKLNKKTIEDLR